MLKTTDPGHISRNTQLTQRATGLPGNDHLQRVYELRCLRIIEGPNSFVLCAHVYGANGSDIFERKCPKCQGGAEGLSLVARDGRYHA